MKKKLTALFLCLAMVTVLFAGCGGNDSNGGKTSDDGDGKYKIALSNSYVGNDWRQLMIKSAQVAAQKDEYKDIVDLTIVNCENTAEAQSASIDALVEQGYDAILIDAASTTGCTTAINRAIEAGVVCVTFDCIAEADGIYTVSTNFSELAEAWANYLVAKVGEGGKVAIDTGLSGSTVGNTMYEVAMDIFEENGIQVVAEFASDFADGVGQQEIASVLAANPDLDGIYTQVYGETIQKAFETAGRDYIPSTAYTTNAGCLAAIENDMELFVGCNYAGQGALAMDIAIKVLNGEEVEQAHEYTPVFLCSEEGIDVGYDYDLMEIGVNCFEGLPGALMLPVMPADFEPQITAEEVSDYELN